uniref:Aminotransferase class I/classII large domain-containing protein n=2 Tax=Arion vulgaris TaxID=1028688 RepID=A0A0B7A264_9EUPU
MSDELSKQAQACIKLSSYSGKYFKEVRHNRYHPTENPEGVADLGLAENKMCADLLIEKLSAIAATAESKELMYYEKATGNLGFRQFMKLFIEKMFHAREEINPDHVFITNGVTVVLEDWAFALADPGDYIMVPSPYYYRTKFDIFERPGVLTLNVPLTPLKGDNHGRLTLSAEVLEQVYQTAVSEGKRVRAVMVNNPVNPTGDVIGAEQLTELLNFAHRHKLHVLSNEIYGLSVHDPDVKFTSILELPHPDPERVHFTWGVSKDTGLSGYRCGFVHTRNPAVLQYLNGTLIYFRATGIIQHRLQEFFGDLDWVDRVFFQTMKQRIHARFNDMRTALETYGVHVHPGAGTMFIWADFTKFIPEQTFAGEQWLFHQFLKEKVFIVPGYDYSPDKPGWFRIVFTVDEAVYQEGKKHLITVLKRLQQV